MSGLVGEEYHEWPSRRGQLPECLVEGMGGKRGYHEWRVEELPMSGLVEGNHEWG